jgi:membrane-associated phospholipid phosphatase
MMISAPPGQRSPGRAKVAPVPRGGLPRPNGRWVWWPAVGFLALYLGAVRTTVGQQLDQAVMIEISALARSFTGWADRILQVISPGSTLVTAVLVITATAARRGVRRALIGAGAAITVFAGAELLKLVLDRPALLGDVAGNSFPSGHVAAVAGLATALVTGLPRAARWPAGALLAGPAVGMTGLATIVLQWHRPSDVLGAVLLAVAVGAAAIRLADHGRTDPGGAN